MLFTPYAPVGVNAIAGDVTWGVSGGNYRIVYGDLAREMSRRHVGRGHSRKMYRVFKIVSKWA